MSFAQSHGIMPSWKIEKGAIPQHFEEIAQHRHSKILSSDSGIRAMPHGIER
jgi:hypothetical protein